MFYEQFVIDFGSRFYRLNLKNNFTDIIFICVGSNKITGDSLGPIVGAKLKQKLGTNIAIIGTTETPVNYENIKEVNDNIKIKMIGNRTLSMSDGEELYNKLNSVVTKFLHMNMEYLGSVPFDVNLTKAVMKQQPVSVAYPNTPASKSIKAMAEKLANVEPENQRQTLGGLSGLFSKMFRNRNK